MTAEVRRVADALPEDELLDLVRRCRAADGGMPLVTEPWFLRGRWLAAGTVAFEARDGGALIAAAAVRPSPGGPMISGLVDPAFRGQGLGSRLLDAALAAATDLPGAAVPAAAGSPVAPPSTVPAAGGSPVAIPSTVPGDLAVGEAGVGDQSGVTSAGSPGAAVTVECEGLTAGAAELFASRGLLQVFGEDVMRIKVAAEDGFVAGWPAGAEVVDWSAETAERFHAVYAASFRDRPGFPDPSAQEWIEENTEDDDFRPEWSIMVALPGRGDVGFVTAAEGWIVQVGVVPAARGTGLGGALIRESLRRMAAAGATEAWLTVNVNNPSAAGLYRRLGFDDMGQRARYR
ncbi:GNAT family N-acetyltransferase [Actinoplanes sp. NPDC026670]|uniref:GNAT family N-acetyltransferase n=1 Tax=Actinoplanes sp. NPDC026670 TaxID=3154700 RepID=UPI0033D749CC